MNLDEELNTAFKANASENLEKIQKLFSIIGVSIRLSGKLPDDTTTKNILFEIIREASTNAVKHGNAKEINIQTYTEDKTFFMIISNDGKAITNPVIEGNGLKGMKEKIEKIGGKIHYEITPKFCLHISIKNGSLHTARLPYSQNRII